MKFVTLLSWSLRVLLFVALLTFAVRNTDPVTVRLVLDRQWEVPLVLALLVFFAAGAAFGVVACLARVFRQRREIVSLKRELRARPPAERSSPPPPEIV
jgi:uncharacterized integral membrane protein